MKPVLIFILFVAMCFSCNDAKVDYHYVDAVIVYTGDPNVDGCGYMLKVDTISFKPQNLPLDFQQDELNVKVDFSFDGKQYFCGDLPYSKKTVTINSIKKK